jgi:hypothetical protein
MSDYMIADKDDEWKEEMLQNVLLGATFQSSNIESYRDTMLNLYKVMQKINPASAQEGKDLAKYYFKEQGKDFPLELPTERMFEQMSEIAAAAIFATRIVEVAEEGLVLLSQAAGEMEEKTSKFQEDNS